MTFQAILFDCDGVLVDSEAITCGVLRDMFEEQGWRMTLAECMQRFVFFADPDGLPLELYEAPAQSTSPST